MDDVNFYIGTLGGAIYGYNLKTIRDLWEDRLLGEFGFRAQVWSYQSGSPIMTTPVASEGSRAIAFASANHMLSSIGALNGEILFLFETDDKVSADIGQAGRFLLMASDYQLYCIDINNGDVRWVFAAGRPIREKPVVIDNRVYVAPEFAGLVCLSLSTGERIWRQPDATDFLAATPSIVFALGVSGSVILLRPSDGLRVGQLHLNNYQIKLKNERTDRLFMATQSGRVVCIRELGRRFPLYHKFPDRKPLLPEFAEEGNEPPPDGPRDSEDDLDDFDF